MSDVKKEVGVIGQKYEDRNTGKTGVLDSRDEKCKTLMMIGEDGKGFSISYSSFRSRWRKCVDAITEKPVKEESAKVETKKVEKKKAEKKEVVKVESVVDDRPVEEVMKEFNAIDKNTKIVASEEGVYSFAVECENQSFIVMKAKSHKDGSFAVECFPDVYTDSDVLQENTEDFKCSRTKSGLDLKLKVGKMSFGTLVNAVKDAIIGINLYGYIVTE